MRLLRVDTLEFAQFRDDGCPAYAIASHRWQEEEVTFQEVNEGRNTDKKGYKKVRDFAKYIRDSIPAIEWLWIDTCCINKDSAAELSEAINLMFKWYRNAEICLAYLADVDAVGDKRSFMKSEWFERGWTLQELLAPRTVVFVTNTWQVIGNKGGSSYEYSASPAGPGLEREIAARTGIPEQILHDYGASQGRSVDERLKWMEGRKTSRVEDMSYALFGIFGVAPGANYGEEVQGARQRLMGAIQHEKNLAAQQAEQAREIAAWLSPPNPWTNHDSARQRHEHKTGTWLLECNEYRDWKSGSLRHLWLNGKVGCGKTVLCSTAAEDVKEHCKSAANAGYAVFYLSFSDTRKQRYEDMLLSWVAQLCLREPALSMLQQAYENPSRGRPGQHELAKTLLAGVETYDEVFLLVDALDECPEDGDIRHYMMECLARLLDAAPQLKILATSRDLPDIRQSMVLLGAQPIFIQSRAVDADIRAYVATQMSRDHRLSRLDPATKALIEDTFSEKADGMFRWAYCHMQELKKLKSTRPKVIEKTLYSLPATLDETYERMLTRIEEDLRSDAVKLLRWLAYAKSPPSLGELVDATVIDLEAGGSVEVDNRPGLDDTLEILSGLVTIGRDSEDEDEFRGRRRQQDREDTEVRLAHFSVKEYLESKRILESHAKDFYFESSREHRILCQSCITYIMHYSRSAEKLFPWEDRKTFPLLQYASETWFYHSALQQTTSFAYELGLLCDEGILRDWLKVPRPLPDQTSEEKSSGRDYVGSGLYYASALGLEQVVGELIATGADINYQGGVYRNALQVALLRHHRKVVRMLVEAGADANSQGGPYGNALQAASVNGYEEVVRMLIDAGAEVNAQGGEYSSALQAASARGSEKAVQILIDAGANVNVQGGLYGNALHAASFYGYKEVVQMLVDAGVDVNAQGRIYGNALQAASAGGYEGYEKVVQILIDAGADVNAQEGIYGNALQAALAADHEKVVHMLLDAGADVNAQGGEIYLL